MAVVAVTAGGQVPFRKEVLQHLGIRPGNRISLEFLRLSFEEMNDAISDARAAAGMAGIGYSPMRSR